MRLKAVEEDEKCTVMALIDGFHEDGEWAS
jgi:hypothetical protein